MIYCTLNLREVSRDGRLKLRCAGSGSFDVFSGFGEYKNNADYYMKKNGPIPPGIYWIVDRPTGGISSWFKQVEKEWRTGNNYDDWFALYKDDGIINDQTIVVFKSFIGHGQQEVLSDERGLLDYDFPFDEPPENNHHKSSYVGTDDRPFVYETKVRSSFRLHPLRPDGTGVSDGCITFYNSEDFYRLRFYLLNAIRYPIAGGRILSYGQITVTD
ncbi:DUF2778 domain-containing protein [Citrobacter sp. NCU1]|uniref:DUF2778 domain-containing protein n=1 Tax=Citrobacter sp. NCU1 TaxID=2026683 RepID=UPI001EE2077E|nr:DUF2778 domain-containing protein [Citrobacter sp. NCU1]